jgi:hypothetical protein
MHVYLQAAVRPMSDLGAIFALPHLSHVSLKLGAVLCVSAAVVWAATCFKGFL